ncbi:hypothetical protein Pla22_05960 [Rubripirellula amarantea]|uniref:DUF4440 domain-containing protein n=1 Tax=Rubripirellula amarantea TaxID=2527999 RepID=A0A5C5WQS7_9BACT|nr:SgcJ/EcaC family oxidoreductase [Rubripirellula amarantea]TWT52968.1 hypothetical protein Pla22_05960 [Rubripirellula amarantea]
MRIDFANYGAVLCLPVALFLCGVTVAQEPVSSDAQSVASEIEGYVKDFNDANVDGIAARWMDQGRMTNVDGSVTNGREEIVEQLTSYFADAKGAMLSVDVKSIELISPSVARETGVATLSVPDGDSELTSYVAIHIKTASGWKLDSIEESQYVEPRPSSYEHLKGLEWMIGTWAASDDESSITTTCRWSKNQNFIIRSFAVEGQDDDPFEGTQVVGWDPIHESIRSWTFDSDGGYAAGRWTNEGNRWTVNSKSVLPDGRVGSSTHVYRLGDDGSLTFQSIARQVDGELLPSIGPVTVDRKD